MAVIKDPINCKYKHKPLFLDVLKIIMYAIEKSLIYNILVSAIKLIWIETSVFNF